MQNSIDYMAEFKTVAPTLPGSHLSWLNEARKTAMQRFSKVGFPSPRDEEWRHTNVAPIERKLFKPAAQLPGGVDEDLLKKYLLKKTYTVVLVDGFYSDVLSNCPSDSGIIVSSMANALVKWPEKVESVFGQTLKAETQGFIDFNTAFFSDGLFIHIDRNVVLEQPIHLLNYSTLQDALVTTRSVIVLEQGAQAEIIESYVTAGNIGYLIVPVLEVIIKENAHLEMTKLQLESLKVFHFGGVYVQQSDYGVFRHHNYAFGGLLVRNEIHCDLDQASESHLNGLFLATKRQHLDNHTHINHLKPHAISREMYKGILDDRARGVFRGRVVVHPDAQKTDSEMRNRNLLLSDNAEIDSKPQLEIYADDVKCAHGVTVGQLQDESVFYLRSRGVDEAEARSILTFAFANEMVDKLQNCAIREVVLNALLEKFPQSNVKKEWL
ncbi:MAG: Fe-S cluster assembly protein SufD [Methylococcales bacterium]